MKAAILYCLIICAYLVGTAQTVHAEGKRHATAHSIHNILQSKHVDRDDVIDIEDDNDDDYLTRKITIPERVLSTLSSVLFATSIIDFSNNLFSDSHATYAPCDIIIVQRVMRI